jgi:hypothetical protein
MIKVIGLILSLVSLSICQEVKAVILNSGCSTNFWGTECFTAAKTLEKDSHTVHIHDNYGVRGDTIILIPDDRYIAGYRVK